MRPGVRRAAAVLMAGLVVAGCGAPDQPGDPAAPVDRSGPKVITAQKLLQVTKVHAETGMTLLEGPVFLPDGSLLVVDVTAPAGKPKILRIDVDAAKARPFYTDKSGVYTSAQLSPYDNRLYLTDFVDGGIDSISLDGKKHRTFFTGEVDGSPMKPDDIAFDQQGNLYVSDTTGHDDPVGDDRGRVVRIDRDGEWAGVVADRLPAPNGISFDAGFQGLWVAQYAANRIDYLALAEDGKAPLSAHPAVHVNAGAAQIDSTAVDADGNIYQMAHNQPRVRVFSPQGDHLATVDAPTPHDGAYSATNLAIRPGTREAYLTVSGPSGGFVYSFPALGRSSRQSNGG